jgi:hypothetical protein
LFYPLLSWEKREEAIRVTRRNGIQINVLTERDTPKIIKYYLYHIIIK